MSLGNPRAYQFKNIESIYGIVSRSNNNQEIREAHFWAPHWWDKSKKYPELI